MNRELELREIVRLLRLASERLKVLGEPGLAMKAGGLAQSVELK